MKLEYPDLPSWHWVRQEFDRPRVTDVPAELRRQLDGCGVTLRRGGRYAIGVGSRGIANLPALVRGVVDWVRAQGGATRSSCP